MYRKYIKRLIDIVVSLVALVVLAIPMLILAIIVKVDSEGPAFFWQKRIALHKRTFMMPKFRSMYIDAPAETPTHLLTDSQRWITPVGKAYRKLSIDELPQIWCVFAGKMSIVGPRPALWNQFDLIEEREKYGANDVRPGITGWAQINGRDELDIPVKAKLDGEYVERMSFLFDCKCFFGTVLAALRRDGVVEGGTDAAGEEQELFEK